MPTLRVPTQLLEALQLLEQAQPLLLPAAAAAAALVLIAVAASRRRKAKNKRVEAPFKWSAVVDWRGLLVEARGPADAAIAAYVVQAARVLEEVGKPVLLRAQVGDLELELAPQEEGLYKVVAR